MNSWQLAKGLLLKDLIDFLVGLCLVLLIAACFVVYALYDGWRERE